MANDIFTLDENNNAAIRTLSVNPGDPETNSPSVFTLDEDGNACIRVTGTGGGGGGDLKRTIIKSSTIPTADSTTYRDVYMYVGTTDANYTHGYIYECQKTSATYTGTVSFEPATLSGTTVTCDGDDFANFLTEAGADPTPIVSGTMTYDSGADGWRLVGKDAEDNTITSFIEYTEDYTDHGFAFTGTPQDGDVVDFTCTITETSATYAWVRLDVQPTVDPLPDQTGNAGKFLTTDGTDASWSDKPLVNDTNQSTSLTILGTPTIKSYTTNIGYESKATKNNSTAVGAYSQATGGSSTAYGRYTIASGEASVCIGNYSTASGAYSIVIGLESTASAANSIEISTKSGYTNSDANTFKVGNDNGNFEIMSADGTIPAARHASLPVADGTYVLKLVIADGTPTLSWVAE